MPLRGLELTPGAAGADEVGRGALAGPVVCAAVVLPDGFDVTGLDDSKKLTPRQREIQAARIAAECQHAVSFISVEEVDELNVLQASLLGMRRSVESLPVPVQRLLVDGRDLPWIPGVAVEAHIKGDGRFAAIAAASILAKVARDARMRKLAISHPGYGLESNMGYAAPQHLEALRLLGPSPIHRRTFEPVRSLLLQPCLLLDM